MMRPLHCENIQLIIMVNDVINNKSWTFIDRNAIIQINSFGGVFMIKRAKDIITDSIDGFKGGKGNLKMTRFVTAEDIYDKGRFMGYGVLEVGGTQGYHEHFGEFETIYILEGKAKASDNGTEVILEPGDVLICQDGAGHSLENIGDTELKYMAIILNS